MSTSLRFRRRFKEEQQAECLQFLEPVRWQRFTSQAKPLRHMAWRLRDFFSQLWLKKLRVQTKKQIIKRFNSEIMLPYLDWAVLSDDG